MRSSKRSEIDLSDEYAAVESLASQDDGARRIAERALACLRRLRRAQTEAPQKHASVQVVIK